MNVIGCVPAFIARPAVTASACTCNAVSLPSTDKSARSSPPLIVKALDSPSAGPKSRASAASCTVALPPTAPVTLPFFSAACSVPFASARTHGEARLNWVIVNVLPSTPMSTINAMSPGGDGFSPCAPTESRLTARPPEIVPCA